MGQLLPPNATALEHHLAETVATISDVKLANVSTLWNADNCPAEFLPWLAFALRVDVWDSEWSDETKRQILREADDNAAKIGSVTAVRNKLTAMGQEDATILEGLNAGLYDGSITHDGTFFYGGGVTEWASYRIYLQNPITLSQANQLRRQIEEVAPIRSDLVGIHFTEVASIYNGAVFYDGTKTHGTL